MKKRFFSFLPFIFVFSLLVFILFNAESSLNAAKDAVFRVLTRLIPSIFPALVLSGMINDGRLFYPLESFFGGFMRFFKLPPCASAPFIVGVISGFPVGAVFTARLFEDKKISRRNAERMLALCNLPSPAFAISVIGLGVFKSMKTGVIIWLSSVLATVLISLLFSLNDNSPNINFTEKKSVREENLILLFVSSVKNSSLTMIMISAFVIFFAVLVEIIRTSSAFELVYSLFSSVIDKRVFSAVILGFLEISTGLSFLYEASPFQVGVAAAVLTFSGICVLLQSMGAVFETRLSFKKYFIIKLISSVISFVFAFFITLFL